MFIELVWNRAKFRVKKWKWHFLDNNHSIKKEPHRALPPQGSYREKRSRVLTFFSLFEQYSPRHRADFSVNFEAVRLLEGFYCCLCLVSEVSVLCELVSLAV